jgi:hypothetical protein
MIPVSVSGDQMVDVCEPGVFDGGHDALRISDRACTGISRIEEQRFAGRRHEKGGISAFDVYDIDIQGLARAGLGSGKHHS